MKNLSPRVFLFATFVAAPSALGLALPSRIAAQLQDDKSVTTIAVLDENLDLAARLQREAQTAAPALVPLAPALVVGQGDDALNHTFVRVLNRWGIAQVSFLAFTPDVRGGVQVAAGRDGNGVNVIAAAPIGDAKTREIRLFNRLGGRVGAVVPGIGLRAPYRIACGDYLPTLRGDELAVTAANAAGETTIAIFDFAGALRKTIVVPDVKMGAVSLASVPDQAGARLALYFPNGKILCEVTPSTGAISRRTLAIDDARQAIYPTAFANGNWLASGPEPLLSTFDRIGAATSKNVNVGAHENEFWITATKQGVKTEGRYVLNADYAHRRVESLTPLKDNPQLASSDKTSDQKKWADAARATPLVPASLAEAPRTLWEPTFTHRMTSGTFDEWAKIKDEATGLPKYLSLTRKNNPSDYGEFTSKFATATYALGVPELDRLYLLPLRGFLDTLSQRQRAHPDRVVSVEPNHEHEIAIRQDQTVGDYNPAMIRGYSQYLQQMSGLSEAAVKARYGLPAAQGFDAPRNEKRGAWDAYDEGNPFFMEWGVYNRYVVNRRLADTFTAALQAGLPPELIKSHQIPDNFAIGSLKGFSDVRNRITPIDYAMSAGVGFGYTRYGVWFEKDEQVQKAAKSSGFDSVVVGEYQALTPDQKLATAQLNYMFENGVVGINAMKWPQPAGGDKFNPTMARAIEDLVAQDRPRPGVTGGVGQVVPWSDGTRRFDIAAIGTGPNRTGLIKSLDADGGWEGSVYAVPFRTAIALENLPVNRALTGGEQRLGVGPLNQLEAGEQIELTLRTSSKIGGIAKFALRQQQPDGRLGPALSGTETELNISAGQRNLRLILRSQLPADGVVITLEMPNEIAVDEVVALRETEQIARVHRGVRTGERHRGGVTFAILD